ncbi:MULTISPECIES: hypothetical protein [unclassified Nocardioides]|uniref:hypothetical protein n=1 Tax=unclassified Nocardioides TaxID=2615069 RepID=UPI0006F7EA3D|nr:MULTISPECIES: hypothetical protein [unclassified Nocardioides]KRA38947.1 hypothetical protein ASD81_10300 [Nocardioides sp. Root614]KRA92906.1 hypothetical protein ASD84_10565 [Nocardioides sp. Root682]
MTAFEVGTLLLLLGSLLTTMFVARAWCIHSFSLESAPGTAPAHRADGAHAAHGHHFVRLAIAGASVYVGRQLAPVVLAVAVGAMTLGATLRVLAS